MSGEEAGEAEWMIITTISHQAAELREDLHFIQHRWG